MQDRLPIGTLGLSRTQTSTRRRSSRSLPMPGTGRFFTMSCSDDLSMPCTGDVYLTSHFLGHSFKPHTGDFITLSLIMRLSHAKHRRFLHADMLQRLVHAVALPRRLFHVAPRHRSLTTRPNRASAASSRCRCSGIKSMSGNGGSFPGRCSDDLHMPCTGCFSTTSDTGDSSEPRTGNFLLMLYSISSSMPYAGTHRKLRLEIVLRRFVHAVHRKLQLAVIPRNALPP